MRAASHDDRVRLGLALVADWLEALQLPNTKACLLAEARLSSNLELVPSREKAAAALGLPAHSPPSPSSLSASSESVRLGRSSGPVAAVHTNNAAANGGSSGSGQQLTPLLHALVAERQASVASAANGSPPPPQPKAKVRSPSSSSSSSSSSSGASSGASSAVTANGASSGPLAVKPVPAVTAPPSSSPADSNSATSAAGGRGLDERQAPVPSAINTGSAAAIVIQSQSPSAGDASSATGAVAARRRELATLHAVTGASSAVGGSTSSINSARVGSPTSALKPSLPPASSVADGSSDGSKKAAAPSLPSLLASRQLQPLPDVSAVAALAAASVTAPSANGASDSQRTMQGSPVQQRIDEEAIDDVHAEEDGVDEDFDYEREISTAQRRQQQTAQTSQRGNISATSSPFRSPFREEHSYVDTHGDGDGGGEEVEAPLRDAELSPSTKMILSAHGLLEDQQQQQETGSSPVHGRHGRQGSSSSSSPLRSPFDVSTSVDGSPGYNSRQRPQQHGSPLHNNASSPYSPASGGGGGRVANSLTPESGSILELRRRSREEAAQQQQQRASPAAAATDGEGSSAAATSGFPASGLSFGGDSGGAAGSSYLSSSSSSALSRTGGSGKVSSISRTLGLLGSDVARLAAEYAQQSPSSFSYAHSGEATSSATSTFDENVRYSPDPLSSAPTASSPPPAEERQQTDASAAEVTSPSLSSQPHAELDDQLQAMLAGQAEAVEQLQQQRSLAEPVPSAGSGSGAIASSSTSTAAELPDSVRLAVRSQASAIVASAAAAVQAASSASSSASPRFNSSGNSATTQAAPSVSTQSVSAQAPLSRLGRAVTDAASLLASLQQPQQPSSSASPREGSSGDAGASPSAYGSSAAYSRRSRDDPLAGLSARAASYLAAAHLSRDNRGNNATGTSPQHFDQQAQQRQPSASYSSSAYRSLGAPSSAAASASASVAAPLSPSSQEMVEEEEGLELDALGDGSGNGSAGGFYPGHSAFNNGAGVASRSSAATAEAAGDDEFDYGLEGDAAAGANGAAASGHRYDYHTPADDHWQGGSGASTSNYASDLAAGDNTGGDGDGGGVYDYDFELDLADIQ